MNTRYLKSAIWRAAPDIKSGQSGEPPDFLRMDTLTVLPTAGRFMNRSVPFPVKAEASRSKHLSRLSREIPEGSGVDVLCVQGFPVRVIA